jgi:hypothetical protein
MIVEALPVFSCTLAAMVAARPRPEAGPLNESGLSTFEIIFSRYNIIQMEGS